MAADAISTPTFVDEVPFRGRTYGIVNGYDTDFSTAISIISAAGTGKSVYLQIIILQSDDADAHPHIQDGSANVLFGPLFSAVEGPGLSVNFGKGGIKVSNSAVAVKAAAAGNVFFFIKYATAED